MPNSVMVELQAQDGCEVLAPDLASVMAACVQSELMAGRVRRWVVADLSGHRGDLLEDRLAVLAFKGLLLRRVSSRGKSSYCINWAQVSVDAVEVLPLAEAVERVETLRQGGSCVFHSKNFGGRFDA